MNKYLLYKMLKTNVLNSNVNDITDTVSIFSKPGLYQERLMNISKYYDISSENPVIFLDNSLRFEPNDFAAIRGSALNFESIKFTGENVSDSGKFEIVGTNIKIDDAADNGYQFKLKSNSITENSFIDVNGTFKPTKISVEENSNPLNIVKTECLDFENVNILAVDNKLTLARSIKEKEDDSSEQKVFETLGLNFSGNSVSYGNFNLILADGRYTLYSKNIVEPKYDDNKNRGRENVLRFGIIEKDIEFIETEETLSGIRFAYDGEKITATINELIEEVANVG